MLTGTAKNDNVSKTKQEILTPDATFIAALIATFIAMCCTCVSHMLNICLLSVVNLGYVCVPPRQAPIEGSPESFWDSAKIYLIYFCLSLRFAASAIVFKITTGITTG